MYLLLYVQEKQNPYHKKNMQRICHSLINQHPGVFPALKQSPDLIKACSSFCFIGKRQVTSACYRKIGRTSVLDFLNLSTYFHPCWVLTNCHFPKVCTVDLIMLCKRSQLWPQTLYYFVNRWVAPSEHSYGITL